MPEPIAPVKEAAKIIADVITAQLGLVAGQIMLTNQKWIIPETQGLYVAISYVSGKVIGNTNYSIPTSGGMQENQELVMLYQIQIDLMSYDDSARVMKELAYMGLLSVASQQIQETYNVQIARDPQPFQDVSMLEESGRLNRYTTLIAMTQLITNTNANVPYFSDFTQSVPPQISKQQ
jgi:hypothetical protein